MATRNDLRHRVPIAIALLGLFACGRPGEDRSAAGRKGVTNVQPAAQEQPYGLAAPSPPVAGRTARGAAEAASEVSTLDDAQLAAVLQSLHQRLERGDELAEQAGQAKELRDLAHQSSELESDLVTRDDYVVGRLSLTPRVTLASQRIDNGAERAVQTLSTTRGGAFDHDYLAWRIQALKDSLEVLDAAESTATNGALRTEVARDRSELAPELRAFTSLQQSGGPGVASPQPPSP